MRTLLLFVLLALSSTAKGEAGVSYLAIQGFSSQQCTRALKVFRGLPEVHLSFLWGTFGTDTQCLRRFFAKYGHKRTTLHVHLANSTCLRAPRYCERGDIFAGYSRDGLNRAIENKQRKLIIEYTQRAAALRGAVLASGQSPEVSVTFGLEDDFTRRAFTKLRRHFAQGFAAVQFGLVRNPNAFIYDSDGAYGVELHAWESIFPAGRACIWSNDGRDIKLHANYPGLAGAASVRDFERNARSYINDGCRVYVWWNSQGIESQFVAPSRRKFRLSSRDIREVNNILRRLYGLAN